MRMNAASRIVIPVALAALSYSSGTASGWCDRILFYLHNFLSREELFTLLKVITYRKVATPITGKVVDLSGGASCK